MVPVVNVTKKLPVLVNTTLFIDCIAQVSVAVEVCKMEYKTHNKRALKYILNNLKLYIYNKLWDVQIFEKWFFMCGCISIELGIICDSISELQK